MADPRIPSDKQKEAQLPDDLDQNPGIGQSKGLFGQHGSKDAELLAGESTKAMSRMTPPPLTPRRPTISAGPTTSADRRRR